jgi:DNA polymerase sigma
VTSRHNFYWIQDVLHNEVLLFKQDANAIMNEMQQVKQILIGKIQSIVEKEFSNYHVDVYGSHATGLCLHWSDIDLVVKPNDEKDF